MFCYLKVSCKDKRILKKLLYFFTKTKLLPFFLKSFSKHGKRKIITVLKSPHVNKTAQEQFEYRLYSKNFLIYSLKPFTFFLLLKKLKNLSFPGLNLEIKGLLGKNQNQVLQTTDPDNIIFKKTAFLYLSKPASLKKTQYKKSYNSELFFCKKYLQLFDLYGEICLKKVFTHNIVLLYAPLAQSDRATAF
jgi:hypothetical protein